MCFELVMRVLRETEGKYFDDKDSSVNNRVSLLNVF